jgi:hypothetical protein
MILNPKVGDKVVVRYNDIGMPLDRPPDYGRSDWPYEPGITGTIVGFAGVDSFRLLVPIVRVTNPQYGWVADEYILPARLERIGDSLPAIGICRGGAML